MSESLNELLSRHRRSEPTEIKQIKEFVKQIYNKPVNVKLGSDNIKIETSNSALAGELRLQSYNIQQLIGTSKKIIIRIV